MPACLVLSARNAVCKLFTRPGSIPAVLPAMQLSRHAWLTLGRFLHVHAYDTQAVDCDSLTYRLSWTHDSQCIVVELHSVTILQLLVCKL